MAASSERTIAIVGAGFAGTAVAIHLLRTNVTRPVRVLLIERGPGFARGVAYAERDFPYILNVPAGQMSATTTDPDEFLRFAQRQTPSARSDDFLPRSMYGDYLEDLLQVATDHARASMELVRHRGSVVEVASVRGHPGIAVQLADGSRLLAHDVILATGNPLPADAWEIQDLATRARIRCDPWTPSAEADPVRPLLIIGSGLTMADVVCATLARTPQRQIHVLSRHGLVPPEQTVFQRTPATLGDRPLVPTPSLRQLVGQARRLAWEVQRFGGDWRTAIATVRHAAPALWQALPPVERRRFLRHVRPYWNIHRHRLPGAIRSRIEALRARGQLKVRAGRVRDVAAAGDELRIRWTPRGQTIEQTLLVGEIANCTGPDYDVRRATDPLWLSLAAHGAVVPDELGLGIRTGPRGALVGRDGYSHRHIYYLGPMLRADHWEATAVAELRVHAEALARYLLRPDRRIP